MTGHKYYNTCNVSLFLLTTFTEHTNREWIFFQIPIRVQHSDLLYHWWSKFFSFLASSVSEWYIIFSVICVCSIVVLTNEHTTLNTHTRIQFYAKFYCNNEYIIYIRSHFFPSSFVARNIELVPFMYKMFIFMWHRNWSEYDLWLHRFSYWLRSVFTNNFLIRIFISLPPVGPLASTFSFSTTDAY